jgi:hypothetical protein
MKEELLDDESYGEATVQVHLLPLQKQQKTLRGVGMVLVVLSILDALLTLWNSYYMTGQFRAIHAVYLAQAGCLLVAGVQLLKKHKTFQQPEQHSFEENEATWLAHTTSISRSIAFALMISIFQTIGSYFWWF